MLANPTGDGGVDGRTGGRASGSNSAAVSVSGASVNSRRSGRLGWRLNGVGHGGTVGRGWLLDLLLRPVEWLISSTAAMFSSSLLSFSSLAPAPIPIITLGSG